ncbi:MAG TPA: DUF6504 family protein [Coriobacteriia bacterium]|nr:DUF6504 family protein [Coriobacteriia bacterium]
MGRDTAIKQYTPLAEGRADDLFSSREGRAPVIEDLRATPWFVPASELAHPGSAGLGKLVVEPIAATWDAIRRAPAAFAWRSRVYDVESVVQTWAVERMWWDAAHAVSLRCWRVVADGGTYDLGFDRARGGWLLLGVLD